MTFQLTYTHVIINDEKIKDIKDKDDNAIKETLEKKDDFDKSLYEII